VARKKAPEEHENHERWLVSYADFITLLFAFFVVMYSVSSVNEGKYRVLSDSLSAAFRSSNKTLMPIQVGQPAKSPTANHALDQVPTVVIAPNLPMPQLVKKTTSGEGTAASMSEIADRINDALPRLINEDLISVRYEDDYVEIEIKSELLFQQGGTRLSKEARDVATKLAKVLKNFPNSMRVEGYTDDRPIKSAVYPSNWELSAARAGAIVRLFAEKGVHPAQLSAVGYAEFRPVADNTTLEGRIKNRRVSVIVLNQTQAGSLREDLIFASMAKNGKPPVPQNGDENVWTQPIDVSHRPVTETGTISVVPGISITEPFKVKVVPDVDTNKASDE